MASVEILTPVHIGTGKKIESPSFHQENDKLVRYSFSELLATVPEDQLLNSEFLSRLVGRQSDKKFFYSILNRYAKYKECDPYYTAEWSFEELDQTDRDIEEQVKSLNIPYIPGSSLKGAIEQGLKYTLLKENFEKVKSHLIPFLDQLTDCNRKQMKPFELKEGFILQLIDGTDQKTAASFFKDLYSCLMVADIPFHNLEIYEASRENIGGQVVWSYAEAIQPNQITEVDSLIQIDSARLERVQKDWASKSKAIDDILQMFTLKNISRACKVYLRDVMECDLNEQQEEFCQLVDEGYRTDFKLYRWTKKMAERLDSEMDNPEVSFLRIGRYTGYYYKTVTWLIKTEAPDIFEEYFDHVFLPVHIKQRNKINLNHFPATRVLFLSHSEAYFPGYIRISL